ncbi:MAG: hypothetical protein AAF481_03575 [Acidobacteriota bacterium]
MLTETSQGTALRLWTCLAGKVYRPPSQAHLPSLAAAPQRTGVGVCHS